MMLINTAQLPHTAAGVADAHGPRPLLGLEKYRLVLLLSGRHCQKISLHINVVRWEEINYNSIQLEVEATETDEKPTS